MKFYLFIIASLFVAFIPSISLNSTTANFKFNQVLAAEPQDATDYSNRALSYYQKGQLALAIADYPKAISLAPDNPDLYQNRGFVYYQQNQLDLAIADYTKAISLAPDNPSEVYQNRAVAYEGKKDLNSAIADYKTVISLAPNEPQIYKHLGVLYLNMGNSQEATTNLEKAQQLYLAQGQKAESEQITRILQQGSEVIIHAPLAK
jgi:tetratricopeptide (TPR) repeat protein